MRISRVSRHPCWNGGSGAMWSIPAPERARRSMRASATWRSRWKLRWREDSYGASLWRRSTVGVCACALALLAPLGARAQSLFEAVDAAPAQLAVRDGTVLRSRAMRIDAAALERVRAGLVSGAAASREDAAIAPGDLPPATHLTVDLFDDAAVTAIVERTAPTLSGGYSLSGGIAGEPLGSFTLVVDGETVAGSVRLPGATYRIHGTGGGLVAVSEVEEPPLECGTDELQAAQPDAPAGTADNGPAVRGRRDGPAGAGPSAAVVDAAAAAAAVDESAATKITVAVFYTPALREKRGGEAAIRSQAELLVEETNRFYEASGVRQRLSLVAAEEVVGYVKAAEGFGVDLRRLEDPADGHMDEVHVVRERVSADIVVLLYDRNISAASLMTSLSVDFARNAFAVSAATSKTFAHELGHIMGLVHDRYVQCGTWGCAYGLFADAFGYVNPAGLAAGADWSRRWRTIMAYGNRCFDADRSCSRLGRFSNANQTYPDADGDPLGVPKGWGWGVNGAADAARVLNATGPTVARFRNPPVTVEFGAAAHVATEGGAPATVTVRLSAAPERDLEIPIVVTHGAEVRPSDFEGIPPSVAFDADATEGSFVVTALDDDVDEEAETLTLAFGELPEGVRIADGSEVVSAATVTLADDDTKAGAPAVTAVEITSDPGRDGAYAQGDEIEVTVRFDKHVIVTGAPQLLLTVGTATRQAVYRPERSGGEVLVFTYTVAGGDADADGLRIDANGLRLGGGAVRDRAGQDAVLGHAAVEDAAERRVDGVAPAVEGATVEFDALTLTFDEALRENEVPKPGAFAVRAAETALPVRSVRVTGRTVVLQLRLQAAHGDEVIVDYSDGTLRDLSGNRVAAFSGQAVTNSTPVTVYDLDGDGLIGIATLAQLDAVRHDPNGDGRPTGSGAARYRAAFARGFVDGDTLRLACAARTGCVGYELLGDLDFDTDGSGGAGPGDAYWNGGQGWEPIAPTGSVFGAVFEGNGHRIHNLFIDRQVNRVGLFGGFLGARVRRVGVVGVDVTGHNQVGGLVGGNFSNAVVEQCYVSGRVSGNRDIGGLAGMNYGSIQSSWATVRVNGDEGIGGLAGGNNGTIVGSYAGGEVVGASTVGGLSGDNYGTVRSSYSTGPVWGEIAVGGLIGTLSGVVGGIVSSSYATGRVEGDQRVRGLIGHTMSDGQVEESYSDNDTTGRGGGRSTAQLQSPTDASGLFSSWNEGDGLWEYGTAAQYPVLKADLDRDGAASWEEFGRQLRTGPSLTVRTVGKTAVLTWTAADAGHWTPPPPAVVYSVLRNEGDRHAEMLVRGVTALSYTDRGYADGHEYQVAANADGGSTVYSPIVSPTDDASIMGQAWLRRLELSGIPIPFEPETERYAVAVGHGVARTNVTAAPLEEAARVDVTPGYTVRLAVGSNAITVVVTSGDGAVTRTYRVTVTRAAEPPVVTLSGGGAVVEGAPAVVVARLDRAPASDLALALSVSETGNVLSGAPPTSLTVPAGATRATLELATDDDRVVEDDGTVSVTLAAGAGYEVGGVDSATVAVRDNDVARFEVTAHPATIEEGGAATLTVSIANGVTFAARRTVRLSVTGLDAGEYRLAPATLELEAGERSVTATFEALEDAAPESPETAEILAEVAGETVATASVTVVDAGSAPSVSGVLQVGNVLQAVAGDPSAPVHGHQWLRGAEPIAGATAAAYTPVDADVSATLSVRVNARGRWRTSAPTARIWAAPVSPPPSADEEELVATTMTLETHLSPLHVTGYARLPDRAFGAVDDPAFALGERELHMFAVNNVGLFALVTDPSIEDAAGLTAYWNGHAIGSLEPYDLDGVRYWIAQTTQPRREYNRYYAGKSDGVRVAVSLRRPLPRVTVAAVSETVAEGSAATFRVELDRPAWSAREVALSVSGTGAMLSPELPVSVRVEADATSATVTVPTVDDAQVEGDGTVMLTLVSGTGYVLGETSSAAVDVTDDDVATFAVSAEPAEIDEGGAAALTVAIANGVTFARRQSIALSATGSATAADYRLLPETLELAAGASSATATLTAVADPYAEPAETVTVRATHDGAEVGSATVTIRASEALPRATVSAVSAAVSEGAPAQFAITLDAPARTALSVSVAVSETGAVLAETPAAAVGFAVGDQTASLALATSDDAVVEADGTLTVTLGAGSGYVLGTATAATVTVTDNDTATFAFGAAADEIDEGGATMVTVTVEDGVTFAEEQSIALSMTGTAAADDYDLSADALTLAAGANSVSATLTAVDDAVHEASETVTLTATHDGSRVGSATVTIRESDVPSEDATLWSLELTGVDIGPFDAATLDYAADVAAGVETTTVRATPNEVDAQVLIADGNGSTVGTSRTVTLAEGGNEIAVTVTAADGTTTRTYRIAVTRTLLAAWGERVAERDIRLGSQPSGIWSDGETLWAITDWQTGQVSAYALADGARLPERDIRLSDGNGFPAGLWSDGRTLWVADYNGGVTAHRLSDGSRLAAKDLDADVLAAAGNHQPTGLWSDGATLWVADYAAWKVFAYRLSDKARVPGEEFALLDATGAPVNPFGLWSDGRTALASAYLKGRVLGYRLADGGLDPERALGVLAGSGNPMGVWSDGQLLWVVDDWDGRAYAYSVQGLGSGSVGSAFPIRAVNRADRVPAAAAGGRVVSIPDAALRARVAAALGKPGDAVIGERELAALASLDARGAGVSDLTGIEYAAHLTALDLGGNAVVDLGPLAALATLEVLNLDGAAADLAPVLGLAGLRRLSLRDVGLEDAGKLRGLTALEALDLGGNPVVDLAPLADLSRLEALRTGVSAPAVVPVPR